jgi:tRNA-splicing ligase RtcB
VQQVFSGENVHAKIWTDQVEESAMKQIESLCALPFIHKHVAIMPDVHRGYGSTVGSVIPTKGAIIPAAVGVDIGCGMMAVQLDLNASQLPDSLKESRTAIESAIPHGRTDNGGKNDRGAWGEKLPKDVESAWLPMDQQLIGLAERHPRLLKGHVNTYRHLGSLGTGNHFIEICLDEADTVWVMLHSGSRGIGNRIGSYFISLAKEEMKRWFVNVPDVDLSYFSEGTEYFKDYVEAVGWAQNYAVKNRELMMARALGALANIFGRDVYTHKKAVNCHHNYVERENHFGANIFVTRKGAVRAREGDLGIIPGSMGARSYIVEGLGNKASFNSCSHGAGRTMSRTKARHTFTVEDLEKQTEGVECRKDADIIDEIPGAYKDIDQVMAFQADLVKPIHTLRQIVCVKG